MSNIKNLHLLTDISEQDKLLIEHAALEHIRFSNLRFKFMEYEPKQVIIQAAQGKSDLRNHFTKKRLIEIVNETFGRFFEGKKIIVHPIPYQEAACNVVDTAWVNKQMLEKGVKLKDIAADTGITYTHLSSVISGNKEMTQQMKALFYYYFLSK